VLFERHSGEAEPPAVGPSTATPPAHADQTTTTPGADVTDDNRNALTITSYDLDARFTPASAGIAVRALLHVRNDGSAPLKHLALQVSSTLIWRSVTLVDGSVRTPVPFAQHLIDTDADHTGKASEVLLTLPSALPRGSELIFDTLYSGTLAQSGERLLRLGASADIASHSDWDSVGPEQIALRGFGNVLWYPVASAQLFLGDGAQLTEAVGRMKLREAAAKVTLHVSVESVGEPPVAVYFCGRRVALNPLVDDTSQRVADATTLSSADLPAEAIGFRTLSLFTVAEPEALDATLPDGTTYLLALEGADAATQQSLAAAARRVAPLLTAWLGVTPLTALTLLDHPGQPFEDGPLLVAPLAALSRSPEEALVHGLTHAWMLTGQPWIDEGLATFLSLKWTEREHGRDAAMSQYADLIQPLLVAEPALHAEPAQPHDAAMDAPPADVAGGQALPAATTELYFRRKATAVFFMLDEMIGDDALQQSLQQMRARPADPVPSNAFAEAFLASLDKTSGKDLGWFFNDWVLHDKGLPDLSLVEVRAAPLPAAPGHSGGWIVAITSANAGGAGAEVPLTVHDSGFEKTVRVFVPAFGRVTTRVVVESMPTSVVLNDGSVPEQQTTTHKRDIHPRDAAVKSRQSKVTC
jgi:hypothetical protein